MITVNEIAKLVEGVVDGDGDISIRGMAPVALAKEGDLTFALNEEELKKAEGSAASCVLTTSDTPPLSKTLLRVKDPKLSVTILYNALLELKSPEKGAIHPSAIISESAKLGKNVSVGPNAVIGDNSRIGDNSIIGANCTIGKNITIANRSRLYSNVTVYDQSAIGSNVTIHSGSVIGADGFGYIPKEGKIYKVPQMGIVIIEDNVEIGANACIDRGTFANTVIGKGSKIDNLVQIAHNVKLGRNVIIAGLSGIAGSATVGDNTMMGGNVGVADHVNVGKNVKMAAKTGVHGHVKDNEVIAGYPYRSADDARKLHGFLSILLKHSKKIRAFVRNLPEK
ncbi:MAG: UDP-3-O-(3-hydroxymyristoyl)glucosamine N-acyltransferase [Candidatus Omnitrophota bacterium]|jgi:UDP-3-O-[3-hydroxymyristoyl] glucosamine N-acyltransferase